MSDGKTSGDVNAGRASPPYTYCSKTARILYTIMMLNHIFFMFALYISLKESLMVLEKAGDPTYNRYYHEYIVCMDAFYSIKVYLCISKSFVSYLHVLSSRAHNWKHR